MSYIIGVAGYSGSGKSTFSKVLSNVLNVPVICQDAFYIGKEAMMDRCLDVNNFDLPEALDICLLRSIYHDVKANEGCTLIIPKYDYLVQERVGSTTLNVAGNVIVEGNLIHSIDSLRRRVDFLIYMDMSSSLAKARRFARDQAQRGYSLEECETYYDKYVVDSISQISSLKQEADFVVEVGENNKESYVDDVAAVIDILSAARPL
jgi:uridine kinase